MKKIEKIKNKNEKKFVFDQSLRFLRNNYVNKIVAIGITLLFILSIGSAIGASLLNTQSIYRDTEWEVTLNFTETSGKNDYILFGEAPDASDGVDIYDAPNPPGGILPVLDAYFTTDFPWPHDTLLQEIKAYPDTYKTWNFTLLWTGSDTTVTISWDTDEVDDSEYSAVILCDDAGSPLTDMIVNNNYVFSYITVPQNFTINCTSNQPPEVSDIPDQTITEGSTFATISLDDYVVDAEDPVSAIVWSYSGNSELTVTINATRVATIGIPDVNWTGAETITFQANDSGGLNDTDAAAFTVTAVNDPPVVSGIPDQTVEEGESFVTINLDNYVYDPDNDDDEMTWVASGNIELTVDIVDRVATITVPGSEWNGAEMIMFNATDPGGKSDEDAATFTVNVFNDPPGGNGGPGGPSNQPPIANASAGEPYEGVPGEEITFDGSLSSDPEGTDLDYRWDFDGDGIYDTEWLENATVIYSYDNEGIYTVILQVKDGPGATNTDETTATIAIPNSPPTNPTVNGEPTGTKNTEYTYIAVSTDGDNDTIKYIFNWDDGTNTTTDFLPNGTKTTQNHSWNDAGRYTITVQATDNETYSQTTELIVMIDAIDVGDLGYLTDDDGDEIYDMFHNNTIGIETAVELQDDGTYLIDNDGDGVWDYNYNTTSGVITQYLGETIAGTGDGLQWSFIAVIGIALAIIAVIIYLYKKGSF